MDESEEGIPAVCQHCRRGRGSIPGQEEVFFPIRGIDFNKATGILYTGDEAGYLQKWDLNPMLNKLRQNEETFKTRTE